MRRIRYEIFLSCHSEAKAHIKKFVQKLKETKTWRIFLAASDSDLSVEEQMQGLKDSFFGSNRGAI